MTIQGPVFTPPTAGISSKVASQVKSMGGARPSKRKSTSPEPTSPSVSSGSVPAGAVATIRKGTGIVIAADNVVVRNCHIRNFRTGIKIQGKGSVLLDNTICDNDKDIVVVQAGNYGVKNYCSSADGWREDEKPGCAFQCR